MRRFLPSLKHGNWALFLLTLIVDAYVVLAPLLPRFLYRPSVMPTIRIVHHTVPLKITSGVQPSVSQPNQLIIPAMGLDGVVHEGNNTYAELDKGVWRWPGSSTPDKGGNTVMLGHRFTYTNPRGVFYFLDRVKVGSEIQVVWNNRDYTYRVVSVQTVPATDTAILDATMQPTLTLYTCTPLWNPVNRLVVTAHLEISS